MSKKLLCFIVTIIGIIIIILSETIIQIIEEKDKNKEEYIKENLIIEAKQCIKDEKCHEGDITITMLKENGYLTKELKSELKNYSEGSYVMYPTYEVYLIK